MLDYYDRMWALGSTLHRAFALDLGLDPTFFDDKLKKPMATLRLLHYPPTDRPLQQGHSAPARTPIMATSPCWRRTRPAA